MTYVGRFAPSPTGPLHLGSLVTAVASYLHARQASGEWLVRIDDIDPPREVPGAASQILETLEALDLEWDRSVLYQSQRHAVYRAEADRLLADNLAFRCSCSRAALRTGSAAQSARYPGTCRDLGLTGPDTAVRARVEPGVVAFVDELQGAIQVELSDTIGDYIIVRRDALPAYHLACVVDDAAEGVTTIVRGVDLLDSTPAHVHLQGLLGLPTPAYCHLPILVNERGQKLSKQTGAEAVHAGTGGLADTVLSLLGLSVPADLARARPRELWQWAIVTWSLESLRGQRVIEARKVTEERDRGAMRHPV